MVYGLCLFFFFLGNDFGRVFRWGVGYSGEDLFFVLVSVDEVDVVFMDRWIILLDVYEIDSIENNVVEIEFFKVLVWY